MSNVTLREFYLAVSNGECDIDKDWIRWQSKFPEGISKRATKRLFQAGTGRRDKHGNLVEDGFMYTMLNLPVKLIESDKQLQQTRFLNKAMKLDFNGVRTKWESVEALFVMLQEKKDRPIHLRGYKEIDEYFGVPISTLGRWRRDGLPKVPGWTKEKQSSSWTREELFLHADKIGIGCSKSSMLMLSTCQLAANMYIADLDGDAKCGWDKKTLRSTLLAQINLKADTLLNDPSVSGESQVQ